MPFNTIEILGGLGNQLFQIFALLAYSLRHRTPFYFSTDPIQYGQRKQTYWQTPLLKTLKAFVKPPPTAPTHTLNERGFHYQPLPFYPEVQLKFFGYFQSYKYFADQQAHIYKLLQLEKTQALIRAKTQTQYPYEKNLIAVHFRVGDYVQLPDHHPLMTLAYYIEALSQFLKKAQAQAQAVKQAPYPILYFCEQNDQTYVDTEFIRPLQTHPFLKDKFTFQCIDHGLADWEQLIVMSLCRHHIIANSTFSWWGAYIGGHPPTTPGSADAVESVGGSPPGPPTSADALGVLLCGVAGLPPTLSTASAQVGGPGGVTPQVYYPTTWFGPAVGYKNLADLFPPHWTKIKR